MSAYLSRLLSGKTYQTARSLAKQMAEKFRKVLKVAAKAEEYMKEW